MFGLTKSEYALTFNGLIKQELANAQAEDSTSTSPDLSSSNHNVADLALHATRVVIFDEWNINPMLLSQPQAARKPIPCVSVLQAHSLFTHKHWIQVLSRQNIMLSPIQTAIGITHKVKGSESSLSPAAKCRRQGSPNASDTWDNDQVEPETIPNMYVTQATGTLALPSHSSTLESYFKVPEKSASSLSLLKGSTQHVLPTQGMEAQPSSYPPTPHCMTASGMLTDHNHQGQHIHSIFSHNRN
ncbi:hypothetical protein PAXRUDRAFT_28868 [Paxillus rubicundulus Ve08.2h10]|uniref:Uncharacterized protein n=1 Tax=Paxillus rubicundulus Ve08.2h10 TaxID=930991 RepID=A0A0D0CP69_9AGAM|nr:hypothetical protein PAXRUDRAFT_28868 [Paxillus rubicundulus Ve08.2h10]